MIPRNLHKAGGLEILTDLWGEKADEDRGRGRKAASPPEQPSAACRDVMSPLQAPPLALWRLRGQQLT